MLRPLDGKADREKWEIAVFRDEPRPFTAFVWWPIQRLTHLPRRDTKSQASVVMRRSSLTAVFPWYLGDTKGRLLRLKGNDARCPVTTPLIGSFYSIRRRS